ncbi:MAG: hypothetical protein GX102_15715 [Porphyromonadaceae bacterium]|nr:hypothetical protein [Porphyromonadaceae bacterium]
MNLTELLAAYFQELDPDMQKILSQVYSLERYHNEFYEKPKAIKASIKSIIERVADEKVK